MTMPYYVAPEQIMKDRADYARKGIARGRAMVAVRYADGVALVAERAGAGVPAKVVQLVACGRQLRPADDLAVGG